MIILYARTSTDRQSKGLEAQIRTLREYCKSRGIVEYKVFKDAGISGAKNSRPKLDEVMKLVRAKKVKRVIVYSFSRYARSTKHLLDSLEEFNQYGVDFISISENVDTSTAIGKALFTIISAISQLERELISERVKNGLKNASAKGKQLGRPRTRNSNLIQELRQQGMSYRRIGELCNCSIATVYRELRSVHK